MTENAHFLIHKHYTF